MYECEYVGHIYHGRLLWYGVLIVKRKMKPIPYSSDIKTVTMLPEEECLYTTVGLTSNAVRRRMSKYAKRRYYNGLSKMQ